MANKNQLFLLAPIEVASRAFFAQIERKAGTMTINKTKTLASKK